MYRGVHGKFARRLRDLQPGDIIRDRGFLSTTKVRSVAESHATVTSGWHFDPAAIWPISRRPRLTESPELMTVNVSRARALEISKVTGKYDTEREWVFRRGTRLMYLGKTGNSYDFSVSES